jgi:NADPH:quinone reductase-like Zn-dependent oxidoreductase
MKAAVLHNFGKTPRYEDFADPIADAGETLVQIKAAVLENFDKLVANGIHYSSKHMFPSFPAIAGHSAIAMTPEGKLVGIGMIAGPYGAFAEKAVVKHFMPIPEGSTLPLRRPFRLRCLLHFFL